jgi:hypothetical protein
LRNRGYVFAAALTIVTAGGFAVYQDNAQNSYDKTVASTQHDTCTELDYDGDPASPSSITLKCHDGDEVTVKAPYDRSLFVESLYGRHSVYSVAVTDDGEYRVWYDDSLSKRVKSGNQVISKVTGRNFSQTTTSWSQGWK